ncbi:MAG: TetR/AcrR family transcriptional regulator [Gammaproteobacteria bacterium]|nr:TetR/AcrR family transcriptional regulator [Gammaproteobacteria bacterium]
MAALTEFANLGFEGASTRGIAERADVNHTLITHHFGSKETLWKETASYIFGLYAEQLQRRRDGLAGVDEPIVVKLLLKEFILFSAHYPAFHRFMLQANQGNPERLGWLVNEFLLPRNNAEVLLCDQAQDAGLFPSGDSLHLRYLFIGAVTSIFTLAGEYQQISGEDPFSSEMIDRHVDLVLGLFSSASNRT